MKHLHLAPSWRTVGPIDVSQVSQFTPEEQRVELLNLDEHYYGDMTRKIGGEIHDTWPFDVAQLADVTNLPEKLAFSGKATLSKKCTLSGK